MTIYCIVSSSIITVVRGIVVKGRLWCCQQAALLSWQRFSGHVQLISVCGTLLACCQVSGVKLPTTHTFEGVSPQQLRS